MSNGLYALKPWYADLLARQRATLVRRGVSPNAVTLAGIGFGGVAGVTLATVASPLLAIPVVGGLMALRLAAANLDGAIAREAGTSSRWGAVVNELGDRVAELAVLAGCFALAPASLVSAAMLGASAPSWVALAGAAAGAKRINGGPVGKTERCLLLTLVVIAPTVVLGVLAAGSFITAGLRLRAVHVELRMSATINADRLPPWTP